MKTIATTAERFFFQHAGFSYDPKTETAQQGRRRCAKALAAAEAEASKLGYTFEWEQDDLTNREFTDEGPEYYLWRCCCRDGQGKVRGSLCGVDFGNGREPWGDPYMRVVQAELAFEGLDS